MGFSPHRTEDRRYLSVRSSDPPTSMNDSETSTRSRFRYAGFYLAVQIGGNMEMRPKSSETVSKTTNRSDIIDRISINWSSSLEYVLSHNAKSYRLYGKIIITA